MADNTPQAVNHGPISRAGHALGEASERGLGWGTLGFIAGVGLAAALIAAPFALGWLASGGSLLGIELGVSLFGGGTGAGILTGVVTAPFTWPAAGATLVASTAIGTGIGAYRGASKSADRTSREQAAYEFESAKAARMAENRAQFAAMMMGPEQQQPGMAQPGVAYPPEAYGQMPAGYGQPQVAPTDAQMLPPDGRGGQAEDQDRQASSNPNIPMNQIAADSVQHTRLTPEMAVAKG